MIVMHGFDVYKTYLAFKQHFSKESFDFFKYEGKVKAKEETYHSRNDFYFFETLARTLTDKEIKEYLLASFVSASDPSKVWIGDIKVNGKANWLVWTKHIESITYAFKQDLRHVVEHMETKACSFNDLFEASRTHPPLLRIYAAGRINLESIIILDIVLGFTKDWDKKLKDPLWEKVSFKIKKYKPFLSINKNKYSAIIKETFIGP